MFYDYIYIMGSNLRAKSERRMQAEALRREKGLSYREIVALTGTSRSTLSGWLKDVPLHPEQEARLQARLRANRAGFAARALPINRERHERARREAYATGAEAASRLPDTREVHELALAMLSLGEGSKAGNSVILANTNAALLRFFVTSLRHLYAINEDRLTFRLHLVEAARLEEPRFRAWWSAALGCDPHRFAQTGYDRRPRVEGLTEDYHGVCAAVYHDTALHQRTMGVAEAYLAQRIGDGK